MKEPLKEWVAPPVAVSRNSRYASAGNVTVTISIEMANYLIGRIGQLPSVQRLRDEDEIDLYKGFYKPIHDAMNAQGLVRYDIVEQAGRASNV